MLRATVSRVKSTVAKGAILKYKEKPAPRIEGEVTPPSEYFGLSTLGTSGLKETGGWIYEEFLPQLTGGKAARFYDEMSKNSATLGSVRRLVRDLTRQVEWNMVPNPDAADQVQAKREAEFVDGCRTDMEHSWADLISEALTMLEHGFAPCVITYKLRRGPDQPDEFKSKFKDGRFGWRHISLRSQDTLWNWEFDRESRALLAMWQQDVYAGKGAVRIPMQRIVNFRTESTKDNPEGRPFFRNCVVPYMRLKHAETMEAIGLDRELTGLPVMECPPAILMAGQKDTQLLALRAAVEKQLGSLKRHEREFLLMPAEIGPDGQPTGWKFRLERSPGQSRVDVVAIKQSYKTDIFQACLAQFLQLGQNGNGGARALSSDQTDLFSLALYSLLESIREAFQRQCIDRLCMLNGIEGDCIPQLEFGDIETPNLGQLGTYLTALHTIGVLVPDEELGKYLYTIAGLPWQSPDDKVVPADQLMTEALGEGELSIGDGGGASTDEPDVELLNGAQLASLVQVVEAMASGTLPKDSAATILTATLGIEPGTVDNILAPVELKLQSMGPMMPGAMTGQPGQSGAMPGAMPGQPGAPQGAPARVVQPNELGDPTTQGEGPNGVKLSDQLVDEVLRKCVRDGRLSIPMYTAAIIKRAQHRKARSLRD